jgi:hypothetical protein
LLDGHPHEANDILDALLHWRTASGGSPEVFDSASQDYGTNLPPHGTAAAAIVTLIRNCLVYDDDDTLRLTLGARREWWANGSVHGAPTRWGVVDLHFHSDGQFAEWSWTPVGVPTALTLPPETQVATPASDSQVQVLRPDLVIARPDVFHVRLRITEARSK